MRLGLGAGFRYSSGGRARPREAPEGRSRKSCAHAMEDRRGRFVAKNSTGLTSQVLKRVMGWKMAVKMLIRLHALRRDENAEILILLRCSYGATRKLKAAPEFG
jgi:hypothetical protein